MITFESFINIIKEYNAEEIDIITKAYELAKELHSGQKRQSGEDYIIHPLNVAYILAEMHADRDTICAALLHDTLEDTEITKEEITSIFNENVANLVDGVTKISKMNFSSKEEQKFANTRKIITSLNEDARIIIIKLADRLHNMRTLQYKNVFKQKENSIETLEIFVPLAYFIGAYRIKNELEDLSLKYLKPDKYKKIEEYLEKIRTDSDECIQEMLHKIKNMLEDKNMPYEIKVRIKNIYGIYNLLKRKRDLNKIHDLLALKLMVDEVDDCYRTLGMVHKLYHPLNDKFKDYICYPKTNMYSSLHTTVFGPDGRLVQVQIRTFDMDKIASFGLTTYWDIAKGQARDIMQKDLKDKQFYSSLKEIDKSFDDNKDFVTQVKNEIFSDKIYVYTTKGETIELPKNSTPIDFAYKIHTHIGNQTVSAIVNDVEVPLNYRLKNQDRVKIIVGEKEKGPDKNWVEFVQTTKAKRKIMKYLESKKN